MRTVAVVTAGVLAALAAAGTGFVLAFRTRFGPVLTLVRRFNRRLVNPGQLRTAGREGASTSVVEHVGRLSGTRYRTPVGAVDTGEGFVVALPYGPTADWVRNVLAAGGATVHHDGDVVAVGGPRIVDRATADHHFPPGERRIHALFGVDEFLVLDREP